MPKKRYTPEEIVAKLRQVENLGRRCRILRSYPTTRPQ